LLKEGDSFRKKWNKRFFVVKHDYFIHYYKRKEDYKSGNKPRGIIALCGYKTISDVNNGLIQRAAELAQKMGLDPNSLPKPKQYSENVIELSHPYRKSFFVQCENAEEKKDWIQQFEIVCYNINGFLNKDSVHIKAFQEAIRRTRWSLGRWEFWYDAGTEEQILTDLIASEIELDFIGKILSNLQGPWVIRNFLRNRTLKLLDVMVDSVVSPAWKAMNATVTELRTKVEPVIKEMVEPLGKAKREILEMIQNKVSSTINSAIDEKIKPHLVKIIDIIEAPMKGFFDEAIQIWTPKIEQFEKEFNGVDPSLGIKQLDLFVYSSEVCKLLEKLDSLYEPLWALHEIFPDIFPWNLIWYCRDVIRRTVDNAIYTFEEKLKKYLEQEGDQAKNDGDTARKILLRAREETLEDFRHDSVKLVIVVSLEIIEKIVFPLVNKAILESCKLLLENLNGSIPDAMKQFIDLDDMFNQLVHKILKDVISSQLH